jgi:ABC-type glutathione transport system ATPase component
MHARVSSARSGSNPESSMNRKQRRKHLRRQKIKIKSSSEHTTKEDAVYSVLKSVFVSKPGTMTFAKRYVEE